MPVSSRGFGVKDHKTSFLQFNNPFNTIFQSHFMLSKARISEPFADIDFVEELLFIKQRWHDLIMVHHCWFVPVLHPSIAFQWCMPLFLSNDCCPVLKYFTVFAHSLKGRHVSKIYLNDNFYLTMSEFWGGNINSISRTWAIAKEARDCWTNFWALHCGHLMTLYWN